MKWSAVMNDGSIIKESQINFSELDQSNVKEFYMTETNTESLIVFDMETGEFKLDNIDLEKIGEITDGQKFVCELNKATGNLVLSNNARNNLKSIMKEEVCKFKMGFDSLGNIEVNGQSLVLGVVVGGEKVLFNTSAIDEILEYREAYNELKLDSLGRSTNSIHRTESHNVGFLSTYRFNDIEFKVKCLISYNIAQSVVLMKYYLTADKPTNVSVYYRYGTHEKSIPVYLTEHSPMETRKVISLLK